MEDAALRPVRGNALADSLGASTGLSEKASIERRKEEWKVERAAAAATQLLEPPWWDSPSPGYCPASEKEARVTAARTVLSRLSSKRVGGSEYSVGDLADLRDACAAAAASVAAWAGCCTPGACCTGAS